MVIDLHRFATSEEVIVPIIDGYGKYKSRVLKFPFAEDGWYVVATENQPKLVRKATLLEVDRTLRTHKFLRVYSLGDEGIATNFDNFAKKQLPEAVKVYFFNLQTFEVGKVVLWEDGRLYFHEADEKFQRAMLKELKDDFETNTRIDTIKGLTPELRYYYLILSLQKQSLEEFEKLEKLRLSELEKQKRIKEFQSTFQFRLKDVLDRAGAELLRYYKANKDSYMIHWKLRGTDQIIKSTIHDDFRILSLGFCASGDDDLHSLSSAAQLAKVYGDRINITRY